MLLHLFTEKKSKRPGIIAPLSAVLMVFLLGMVAFTVDIAWMVLAQTELQNVADAAALAGANELREKFDQYWWAKLNGSPSPDSIVKLVVDKAKAKAKELAAANVFRGSTGPTKFVLDDADIEFGVLDNNFKYIKGPTATPADFYPNTIRVTMRRSSGANGSLGLFFGPVLGTSNVDLNNVAAATIFGEYAPKNQVDPPPPPPPDSKSEAPALIPVTFDKDFWDKFWTTGENPDGQVVKDDNGIPKLLIYPTNKYKGNFGMLSLNDEHVGTNEIIDWINKGISQSEYETLQTNNLIPLSKHDGTQWDWAGENGFKSSVVQTINDHVDQISLLPMFKAKVGINSSEFKSAKDYQAGVGQGSNYDFNITGFAPVKIVSAPGDNREIYIQPTAYLASEKEVMVFFATAGKLGANGGSPALVPFDTTLNPPSPEQFPIIVTPKLTQ